MSIAALVVGLLAFFLALFTLLLNLGIIVVKTPQNDKYSKYRNEDGLYSAKKIRRESSKLDGSDD